MSVTGSADQAVRNARSVNTYRPAGMCLQATRRALQVGSREPGAIQAWNAARFRHPGDRKPPTGAPVFWRSRPGASSQWGHIALSMPNSGVWMRSTDLPSSTRVGESDIGWPERQWGMTYLGWTEDLNGVRIPWLRHQPAPEPEPEKVYNAAGANTMIVGQDQMTGRIWLIDGNTKLEFPAGGGAQGGTGNIFADVLIGMIRDAFPGSNPQFVALNPDVVGRIPTTG